MSYYLVYNAVFMTFYTPDFFWHHHPISCCNTLVFSVNISSSSSWYLHTKKYKEEKKYNCIKAVVEKFPKNFSFTFRYDFSLNFPFIIIILCDCLPREKIFDIFFSYKSTTVLCINATSLSSFLISNCFY